MPRTPQAQPGTSSGSKNGQQMQAITDGKTNGGGDSWLSTHREPGQDEPMEDDEEPPGNNDGPEQTEEERRNLRLTLRNFVETLNRDEENLVDGDTDKLQDMLDDVQLEFQKVKMPREGVIQSKCVAMFASLAKRKAQNLNTEFVRFNPVEFVEKVLTFTDQFAAQDPEGGLTTDGWNIFGENTQHYFRRAAPLKCMLGTFDRGEVFTGRVQRARVVREKENITEADKTQLKEVKQGELSSLETTTKEVEERVLPRLIEIYESVGKKPICYFEFVTNPQSYTHTVENIFHVSFLIKSGHAEVFLDDDKLPVIQPVLETDEDDAPSGPTTQMVQSLSYRQWKDIVDMFDIQEPLLETR